MTQIRSAIINSGCLNKRVKYIIVFSFLFLMVIGCMRNKNIPGYEYAPDMSKSVAYETYAESAVFEDHKSALQPVEGTIPREMIPYQYENSN